MKRRFWTIPLLAMLFFFSYTPSWAQTIGVNKVPTGLIPLIEYIHATNATSTTPAVHDVVYGVISGTFAANSYPPSYGIGLVFGPWTATPAGSHLVGVYRCMGPIASKKLGWDASFFSTNPSCTPNPFDNGKVDSSYIAFVMYATPTALTIPLYRYQIAGDTTTTVLSIVPPVQSLLNVMRYQADPAFGTITSSTNSYSPMGYVLQMDANLDGNQRWAKGLGQNLCYGISSYQTTCPNIVTSTNANIPATWTLTNLRTGNTVLSQSTTNLGEVSFTASKISTILNNGQAPANVPLLITVQANGQLLAAKNIRLLRTIFMGQYDNTVLQDDGPVNGVFGYNNGTYSSFPTWSSAYLLGNQMTAHPLFTDPLVNRTLDPVLFDGITNTDFSQPENDTGPFDTNNSLAANLSIIGQKEQHGFQVLDQQGILVGGEVDWYPYWNSPKGIGVAFPMDSTQDACEVSTTSLDLCTSSAANNATTASTLNSMAAYWFNTTTGQFEQFGQWGTPNGTATVSAPGSHFVPDYTNPIAMNWLVQGAQSYLKNLYNLHIHPAFVNFAELFFQSQQMLASQYQTDPTNNFLLPYNQSPTYSASAFQDFSSWMAWVKSAGNYVPSNYQASNGTYPLPVLPADYATAQKAGNPYLYRIQPADPVQDAQLWTYWTSWRRDVMMVGLRQLAWAMKAYHAQQPYIRSPLSTILFDYYAWFDTNGLKYEPALTLPGPNGTTINIPATTWPLAYFYDAKNSTNNKNGPEMYVDIGLDYYIASQQNSINNPDLTSQQQSLLSQNSPDSTFDYFVDEVSSLNDPDITTQINRMTNFQQMPGQTTPKIGLLADIEAPYPSNDPNGQPANNMATIMSGIFPNNSSGLPSYQNPAMDMFFAWEGQCEYLMSMKNPDPVTSEAGLSSWVNPSTNQYQVQSSGGYASILANYPSAAPYCFFRHEHYNLDEQNCNPNDAYGVYAKANNISACTNTSSLLQNCNSNGVCTVCNFNPPITNSLPACNSNRPCLSNDYYCYDSWNTQSKLQNDMQELLNWKHNYLAGQH